ncbi:LuxR C-terminal-related transcriptional regulator [Nocardia sp. GCM10030253]|uniref:LuxR C-terminal-related transcriptional regulator n=1 Tax=Nocardia sp. GCM10030253 TaxID=3273404 RepID=UPI0036290F8E
MLLADWVQRQRRLDNAATSFVWLGLDERDNDVHTLWSSISAAIADPATGLGAPTAAVEPFRLTAATAPEFVSALTSALGAAGHAICLVLDDAHVLHDRIALDSLTSFIRWTPANVTTVVSARHEPPLAWSQYQLEGRLTRVDSRDLALDSSEAAAILADHSVVLSPDLLATMMTLTRGWAAMVRLAAFYLLSRDDAETAVNEFAHSPRAVSDYLVGELLASLPKSLTRFLIWTSPAESFTTELAEELSGQDAARMIDTLERLNFPITHATHNDEPTWFSYHPLLREHLRAELHRTVPEREADLHARAAQWFLARNRHIDALVHMSRMHDPAQLASFAERFGLSVIMDGRGSEMFRVLDGVDTDAEDSFLLLLRAVAALDAGDSLLALTYLDAARATGPPDAGPPCRERWRALVLAIGVATAVLTSDSSLPLLLRQLQQRAATGDLDIDCYTHTQLGEAWMFSGDLTAGEEHLRKAIALARLSGRHRVVLRCLARLAMTAEFVGEISAATSRARTALEFAERHHLGNQVDVPRCDATAAFANYLRGVPNESGAEGNRRHQEPVSLSDESVPAAGWRVAVLEGLACFDGATDPHAAARTLRKDMIRLLTEVTYPAAKAVVLPHVQRICLRVGGIEWADQLIDIAEGELGRTAETLLSRAEVLATQGRTVDARRTLSDVLSSDVGVPATTISAWLLEAVLAWRADRDVRAHDALTRALSLAERTSVLRPFIDAGPPVRQLLALHHGRFGDLGGFAEATRQQIEPAQNVTLPALTPSETNILRHLTSGATSEQIARELYVSVNTIKSHLRGVYRKLGVTSRREALVAARTIGLL